MKSMLICFTATAFIVMAVSLQLVAQEQHATHHHYKLIEVGPRSYINGFEYYGPVQNLNTQGTLIGWADTNTPDPYPSFCFSADCVVTHGFRFPNQLNGNLPALTNGVSSAAHWASANGLVAGGSENGETDPLDPGFPEVRAVLWDNSANVMDLGTLPGGGYESSAHSVNSRGQVVGWALNTTSDPYSLAELGSVYDFYEPVYPYQTRAFLWENGAMQDLGTLTSDGTDAMGFAINEAGEIIGISYTNSTPNPIATRCSYAYPDPNLSLMPTQEPFLWENGTMISLKSLGGTCGWARDLNSHGQLVGASDLLGDQVMHPFLWTKAKGMQDLLENSTTFTGVWGIATKINESGDVVGWANLAGDTATDAFFWDGTMHDLGNIDGCAHAWWINARGQVVGHWGAYIGGSTPYIGDGDCETGSFLWENGGPMVDLATLVSSNAGISVGNGAFDINDRGEIAGVGTDANGHSHAIVLIPCDENHPDVEGCDYSLVDASAPAQARAQSPGAVNDTKDRPIEWQERLNGRLTRHRGFSGLRSPND
jgi:probable HAF family extracellular repeat protein